MKPDKMRTETLDERYEERRCYHGTVAKLAAQTARDDLISLYANALCEEKAPTQSEVAEVFAEAAERGNVAAMIKLGLMYLAGVGVKKDVEETKKCFQKAAEQGSAPAQHNLGLLYSGGHGMERDDTEAVRWFRKAAEQGYAPAQFELGKRLADGIVANAEKEFEKEAEKWLKKASEQGHEEATETLKSGKKGKSWWRRLRL